MAKCPWILHGASGKIGNIVVQRAKGVSTVRELVAPSNPRTRSQQVQRSRFGYLAKFYSEGVRQFFKFSFEHKRRVESDFNAFMRENKGNMLLATRSMLDNMDSCAFGPYRMTSGSIPAPIANLSWDDEYAQLYYENEKIQGDENWGTISQELLDSHTGWQDGDIITFVTIADSNPAATYCQNVVEAIANDSYFVGNAGAIWRFVQVRIDVNDTHDPQDYGIGCSRGQLVIVVSPDQPYSDKLCGGTMVVSRNTPSGTIVCDSYLVIPDGLRGALTNINADPLWREHCAVSLGAGDGSILQGSIVDDPSLEPYERFIVNPDPIVLDPTDSDGSGRYTSTLRSSDRLRVVVDGHLYLTKKASLTREAPSGWAGAIKFTEIPASSDYVLVETDSVGNILSGGNIQCYVSHKNTVRLLLI